MKRTVFATKKVKGYATKRQAKLLNLNRDIDEHVPGAVRAKKVLADTWTRREQRPGSFYKPGAVAPCITL